MYWSGLSQKLNTCSIHAGPQYSSVSFGIFVIALLPFLGLGNLSPVRIFGICGGGVPSGVRFGTDIPDSSPKRKGCCRERRDLCVSVFS